MPGTARPRADGFSRSRRLISAAGTWPDVALRGDLGWWLLVRVGLLRRRESPAKRLARVLANCGSKEKPAPQAGFPLLQHAING